MQTVLIVIHLMIVVALVGVVLLQRSEGGALGIGGGSGGGGLMSARGAADALTRTTGILAAAFFATSIALGIYARYEAQPTDILDRIEQTAPSGGQSVLDQIGGAPSSSGDDSGSADIPGPTSSGSGDSQIPTGQ
ncbi:preprotein translocase subunit SecG [Hoeflea prorocentri]|uniref:Protein-export membrane protein SecG n=1 Tax=Hoeflea prorocentri TaxID=1922333 RepID=A0A9X3ZGZ0_9HYPH|nr:preprotein translocase subunit SecG [Hoeflea prorocentri]MCY6380714.1 preprotein translocase subunit SecG [Hoeflea prorocentri]MDA5398514.1 preprotein translocase subunit SecG [Hoeflea prorocentri]